MTATKVIEVRQEYRSSLTSQHVLAVILICTICIFLSMSLCLVSSYWITSDGFRQGLLYLCIEEQNPLSRARYEPLPFDLNKEELEPGCYPNRDKGESHEDMNVLQPSTRLTRSTFQSSKDYLKFCTFLCLITQLSSLASAFLTGLSMNLKSDGRLSCLRYVICTILVTLICDIMLLYTYPTQFAKELDKSNRNLWELNGAFGLACGSAILAFGTLTLLGVAFQKMSRAADTIPTRV